MFYYLNESNYDLNLSLLVTFIYLIYLLLYILNKKIPKGNNKKKSTKRERFVTFKKPTFVFQVKPFAFYAFFFRNVLTYLVSWSYSYGFGALNPMPKEKMTKGKKKVK